MAAVVGIRNCDLKPSAGIRRPPKPWWCCHCWHRTQSINVEAAALVVLAGEARRHVPRRGCPRDPLSGVTVTERADRTDFHPAGAAAGVGYPNHPITVGQWWPRPTAGPPKRTSYRRCPPARESPSLIRSRRLSAGRQWSLWEPRHPSHRRSSELAMTLRGLKPVPTRLIRWLASTVPGSNIDLRAQQVSVTLVEGLHHSHRPWGMLRYLVPVTRIS